MATRLDILAELILKALALPDPGPRPTPAPKPKKPRKARSARKGGK